MQVESLKEAKISMMQSLFCIQNHNASSINLLSNQNNYKIKSLRNNHIKINHHVKFKTKKAL